MHMVGIDLVEIDRVEIYLVGIDLVEIDLVGIYLVEISPGWNIHG